MRCGSFCANNDMGEGSIIKQCWDSWPVICATACSSNFEIDTVNRPGLVNLWYRKDLLGRWHSWLSQLFLCLLPDRCLYTVKYVCTYTHMWLHIVVHELPLLPNNTVSETFLHKLWVAWSVNRIFITGVPAWWKLGESWHWTKHLTIFLSNRKQ